MDLAPGLTISRVITGLWQIADMERAGRRVDLDRAADAMAEYVDAGFTTFDMADHYGSAEQIVGRFRQRHPGARAEFLTKWVPQPGPLTRDDVRAAVYLALQRMGGDCLDLLQFHAWNYADPAWLDALFWLDELKREGVIRHLGVTNIDTAHLRVAVSSGIGIVSNQVSFSLLDQRAAGRMTRFCLEHGIRLLAYGTVAGGLLTERWLGKSEPDSLESWSEMKYARFVEQAGGWTALQELSRVVKQIAGRLGGGVSMANVACRQILDQPAVGGIIVGARLGERNHLSDNLRLTAVHLDPVSRSELAVAMASLRPIPGDCGDEYRKPPYLTASGDLRHHLDSIPTPYHSAHGADGSTRVLTGTSWEAIAGFSRAVRRGNQVWISGTTATHRDRVIGGADPAAQAHFAIDKIDGALQTVGGRLEDVVRTRVFVRHITDWEPVARAHGERFGDILPANTLVQAELVGDEYLVEIEAEAVIPDHPTGDPTA